MTQTVPDQRLELELPEMFHRKKRTLMLLCGSLILLGCSPAVAETVSAVKNLAGVANPSTAALRVALLAAATYYLWGFAHEFFAAQRVNADLMDATELSGYERQVRSLISKIQEHARDMETVLGNMSSTASEMPTRLEKSFEQLVMESDTTGRVGTAEFSFRDQNYLRLNHSDPAISEPAQAELAAIAPAVMRALRQEAVNNIAHFTDTVSRIGSDQAELSRKVEGLTVVATKAADRIKLNKRIYRDRWFSFWIWEGVASLLVYALAVVFTVSPVGFALGRWLTGVLPTG